MTNDQAIAAGREIGGFPKKLGAISFDEGTVITSALESPAGLRICTGELAPAAAGTVARRRCLTTYYSLRVIPNPSDPRSLDWPADPEHVGSGSAARSGPPEGGCISPARQRCIRITSCRS